MLTEMTDKEFTASLVAKVATLEVDLFACQVVIKKAIISLKNDSDLGGTLSALESVLTRTI